MAMVAMMATWDKTRRRLIRRASWASGEPSVGGGSKRGLTDIRTVFRKQQGDLDNGPKTPWFSAGGENPD
jgi:hypothetical protein